MFIRQRPKSSVQQPATLIYREKPPLPPATIPPKVIVLPGKTYPPPPRKVIVERLPRLPDPPQDVLIERWLSYPKRQRRVVFEPAPQIQLQPAPRNVIIHWDAPRVNLQTSFKYLGVAYDSSPCEYMNKHGGELYEARDMPRMAGMKLPVGENLACYSISETESLPRLVGDLHALRLLDLDRVGLGAYKKHLQWMNI